MSNISLIDGHIDNAEHCVCCGAVIPEGRQVCIICGLKTNYKQSTADVVEVVRCKDCRLATEDIMIDGWYYCYNDCISHKPDDYCSHGVRKDKED